MGYLAAGRLAEAAERAAYALDVAVGQGERGSQAYALHLFGQIAASGEPLDAADAETRYRDALALAEQLEMRPLQAHCHLGLGNLLARLGRHDEARAELTTAVTMLREMGMTFWLPDAEAALAATS